jgi:hypothetical protein
MIGRHLNICHQEGVLGRGRGEDSGEAVAVRD